MNQSALPGAKLILAFTLFSWSTALAQEDPVENSSKLEVKGGVLDPTAVRFIPPPPPKPMPFVPVEEQSVVQKPTHTITLVRGEPSTLPDIPPPPERVERLETLPLTPHRPNFVLGLSVTIYDRQLSHLKWHDPETKEEFEAWCGWDWGLVGPMQEIENERIAYHLFYSPWYVDTTKLDALGRRQVIPEHPAVGIDQFVITVGNADAPAGKPFIEAVQRYCTANRHQLEQLRVARDQYRADAEAWKAANPTRPRNHTIALRPHRGSRYLQDRVPVAEESENSTEEESR